MSAASVSPFQATVDASIARMNAIVADAEIHLQEIERILAEKQSMVSTTPGVMGTLTEISHGFGEGLALIPYAFNQAFTKGVPGAWEALEGPRQLPDAIAGSFTPDTVLTQILATSGYTVGKTATEFIYGAYYDPVDYAASTYQTIKYGISEGWTFDEFRATFQAIDIGVQGQGQVTMAADITAAIFTQIDILKSQAQPMDKFEATMINALGITGGYAGYFPPGATFGVAIDTFTNSRVNYLLNHNDDINHP